MSVIIATPKSWAASAYISHFGGKKIMIPNTPNVPGVVPAYVYYVQNYITNININQDTYSLTENQFSFRISKNNISHWHCNIEPPPEFEELVNLSWPLWEKYTKGNSLYNE